MKESKKRAAFLKTFYKLKQINKEEIKITKEEKNIYDLIYNDISTAYFLMNNKKNEIKNTINKKGNKPGIYDSHFFPAEIREYIKENEQSQLTYTYNDIVIHFTLFSAEELLHLDNYASQVHIMFVWIYICRKYAKKICANKIQIYIYPTPFEKVLPVSKIDILAAEHVNTAYTYHCPNDGEIVIFRNEEWFKVFLHETFHTYGFDFSNLNSNINSNVINATLRRIFSIESEFNAAEAYTETWARIMNCAFNAFYRLPNKKEKEKFYMILKTSLELERTFSIFQCNKILNFMGMSYADLHNKKEAGKRNLYREKTNVFAYYILTAIFMNNSSGFLHWCYTHNESSLFQFNNQSTLNLNTFSTYIEREYLNENLNECLIDMHDFYIKTTKQKRKEVNGLLLETMRMTLFG